MEKILRSSRPMYVLTESLEHIITLQDLNRVPDKLTVKKMNPCDLVEIKTIKIMDKKGKVESIILYNEALIKKVGVLKKVSVDATFKTKAKFKGSYQLLTVMAELKEKV